MRIVHLNVTTLSDVALCNVFDFVADHLPLRQLNKRWEFICRFYLAFDLRMFGKGKKNRKRKINDMQYPYIMTTFRFKSKRSGYNYQPVVEGVTHVKIPGLSYCYFYQFMIHMIKLPISVTTIKLKDRRWMKRDDPLTQQVQTFYTSAGKVPPPSVAAAVNLML